MGYKMDICQVAALRIRKMRLEKNMTIDDLAEKWDVSTQTIKLIEAGRRNFKIKTLYTIANSLNVSSDYLIGRIDTPVPESTVVGNLISELTTEEVIYLVSILSRYVEILKKAGTDRNENSSVWWWCPSLRADEKHNCVILDCEEWKFGVDVLPNRRGIATRKA